MESFRKLLNQMQQLPSFVQLHQFQKIYQGISRKTLAFWWILLNQHKVRQFVHFPKLSKPILPQIRFWKTPAQYPDQIILDLKIYLNYSCSLLIFPAKVLNSCKANLASSLLGGLPCHSNLYFPANITASQVFPQSCSPSLIKQYTLHKALSNFPAKAIPQDWDNPEP